MRNEISAQEPYAMLEDGPIITLASHLITVRDNIVRLKKLVTLAILATTTPVMSPRSLVHQVPEPRQLSDDEKNSSENWKGTTFATYGIRQPHRPQTAISAHYERH